MPSVREKKDRIKQELKRSTGLLEKGANSRVNVVPAPLTGIGALRVCPSGRRDSVQTERRTGAASTRFHCETAGSTSRTLVGLGMAESPMLKY